MTSSSRRRLSLACLVAVAALVALVMPSVASAESDLSQQCSGVNIKGRGSTFQAPILVLWSAEFNEIKGLANKNPFACGGTQGSGGTPKVEYLHEGSNAGSGACLHAFGAETTEAPKYNEFSFCGTDEAPNAKQKEEIESHAVGAEPKSLETFPVLQGSEAFIVHLPEGCLAESEIEKVSSTGTKHFKLGRLVLDWSTVEGVYRGEIKTWKELIEHQGGHGKDKLSCKEASEEDERIKPVVRLDHSGTTHIFKAFLLQVNDAPTKFEAYPETIGGKATGCGKAFEEEEKSWSEVAEGCQNQRWPAAAEVVRPSEPGNPGVVKEVAKTPSSVGYADLAVARENGEFSKKFNKETKTGGGENKKGTETAVGERNVRFWAEVENKVEPLEYADPATNGDVQKAANSNCAATIYTNEAGKKFPPSSTRELWNGAKAELTEKHYSLCGLTYDLAFRQYEPYLGESAEGKQQATTAENFLRWAVSAKTEGGQILQKNHDYEKLTSGLLKKDEVGLEEVGFKTA